MDKLKKPKLTLFLLTIVVFSAVVFYSIQKQESIEIAQAQTPQCGNNITEQGEACDGTDINGYTCSSVAAGFKSGTLSCKSDCSSYNVSQCIQGNTINALSCGQIDVQNAIDEAVDGDTVLVPEGECVWTTVITSTPSVMTDKNIFLKGAGTSNTIITDNTGTLYREILFRFNGANKPMRLSGFTFEGTSSVKGVIEVDGNQNWRVDHNEFLDLDARGVMIYSDSYGVADHNYFLHVTNGVTPIGRGDTSWSIPISLGTRNAVFIEDNTYNYTKAHADGGLDAYGGARYVYRYNDLTNSGIGHHGLDSGGYRGVHSFEIYNNNFNFSGYDGVSYVWTVMHFRSATGVVYNNTAIGGFNAFIKLANYRSCNLNNYPWGRCDGTNPIDGNLDASGYPCSDQIGRSTDTDGNGIQDLEPLYEWNNTLKGGDGDMVLHPHGCDTPNEYDHMQEGRDFFNDIVTYNPLNETYEATYIDDDGSTKQWQYKSYVYPHPLVQIEADLQQPTTCPPSDLNCDSSINASDLTSLQSLWGQPGKSDLNQDDVTNTPDLGIMMSTWGSY